MTKKLAKSEGGWEGVGEAGLTIILGNQLVT